MVIKFKDSEKKLLRILLNSEVTYTAEELSEKMNVSRRSIFYLMKSISKKLLSLNIAPIKNIHGEGYYLSDASKQLISQLTLHESGREDCHSKPNLEIRQAIFFLFLIVNMKVSTLSEISYVTNVSMNTVLNDQKSLLEKLKKFNLDSYGDRNGHHVVGNEKDIRSYIQSNWKALNEAFNVLFRYRKNSNFNELNNIEVYESIIAKWLDLIEANNYFYFSDDSKKRIKFIYALIVL
ncbi:HTH domain-containing protein [Pediococcus acidilactici]|uniref:HTH domain-containing protein n=1 Tax=Pediococcus acidilactici TaxID=1254 RepID=UPI001326C9FD|nr:HTH domain-containing protein [Pediococcus acidilactici]KAF0497299.1 HTH domain-containing protein [Pediococcus acidilactici]KAF0538432.1 HTH domain-containing protein [Pediococcus acidilactici]KAF0545432.1 HTH domain-containing protein [Pediococcus acidilactici]